MENKEFKITKEQILAGAEKCPQAKDILKAMFPDAFKQEETWISIPLSNFTLSNWRGTTVCLKDEYNNLPILLSINTQSSERDNYKLQYETIFRRQK